MLRLHYAYTLRHWLERATQGARRIEKMYDERFFRMWEFYLAGGIVMFESGAGCNYQMQYVRDRRALPITRDYMVEAEERYRRLGAETAPVKKTRRTGTAANYWRRLAVRPAWPAWPAWPTCSGQTGDDAAFGRVAVAPATHAQGSGIARRPVRPASRA